MSGLVIDLGNFQTLCTEWNIFGVEFELAVRHLDCYFGNRDGTHQKIYVVIFEQCKRALAPERLTFAG